MPPLRPTLAREAAVWEEGRLLVGIDEAGRGPLAGPVVAAAVVFPAGTALLDGVRDSKTLPAARRLALTLEIRGAALAIGVAAASVREIDRLNIRVATALAMRRAVRRLLARLPDVPRPCLLVDGLPVPELGFDHDALVDGDAHCLSVAAAGIVAKTVRDRLMRQLALRHAGYGWEMGAECGLRQCGTPHGHPDPRADRAPPPQFPAREPAGLPHLASQNALSWLAKLSGT